MKKLSLLLLVISFTFASCDKDETDVNITTNITGTSEEIVVNDVSARNNTGFYEVEFNVNLENEDTQKYIDRIKKIDIQQLDLFFTGLQDLADNQDPTQLKITIDNDIVFDYTNFVYAEVANGYAFNIDDMQKINRLAELLLSKKNITVKIEGEVPDADYHQFTIAFDALAKITAETL